MNKNAISQEDRPNVIPWPPILYVGVLLLGYVLQRVWPMQPIVGEPVASLIGWPLLVSGLCIGVAAILRFRRLGTPIEPTGRATALATGGIYRWTRNPMYLGIVVAFVGLAVATHWTWLFVLSLILPLALWHSAIKREEGYLTRTFGAEYQAYRAGVRRWL